MDPSSRTATRKSERGPLGATPALEVLLARLRSRLVRKVWMHGAGTLLAVGCLWLAFAFFADWALHVPRPVRLFHLAVLVLLPVAILWRELVRHLRRLPDRAGLAVLLERRRPELRELLVSAVQLQEVARPEGDPELVESVLREAELRARRLELSGVLDERPPRRRFAMGSALAAVLLAAAFASPQYASIFARRLLGGSARWPQLTHLAVSVPLPGGAGEAAEVRASPEEIEVRVARGTDVPVLVRAEGRVPDEVVLTFHGGQEVVLGSSGDGLFRTLLRSCQEDVLFFATGGDDRDGLPRVRVIVLEPPDVAGLAIAVEPPFYSGLSPSLEFDRDVEVLAGSRLSVVVLPHPPEATGRARLLPADELVELEPMPFPSPGGEGQQVGRGLGLELVAEQSLRLRFELRDASGLSNPDPGLFAVHVAPDRRPEVEILAPGRGEVDTVAGGTLALRARAEDDFGIARLAWSSRPSLEAGAEPPWRPLEFRPIPPQMRGDAVTGGVAVVGGTRLLVSDLSPPSPEGEPPRPPAEGQQFLLSVAAWDNRPAGEAEELSTDAGGAGRAAGVRVRVVSTDEFLRRLQDRLSRLRAQASELEELQRQKARRTGDLLAGLESDDPGLGAGAADLAAALAGQRRVQGDADALARELAAVAESVLYARIDDKAGALLEELDLRLAQVTQKAFQAGLWRELSAQWRSRNALSPGIAGQLIGILELALEIAVEDTASAALALDRASKAIDLAEIHAALLEAQRGQELARTHMEELLGRLAEWDNFQSILSLTRDILNRQKALRDRTLEAAREK